MQDYNIASENVQFFWIAKLLINRTEFFPDKYNKTLQLVKLKNFKLLTDDISTSLS